MVSLDMKKKKKRYTTYRFFTCLLNKYIDVSTIWFSLRRVGFEADSSIIVSSKTNRFLLFWNNWLTSEIKSSVSLFALHLMNVLVKWSSLVFLFIRCLCLMSRKKMWIHGVYKTYLLTNSIKSGIKSGSLRLLQISKRTEMICPFLRQHS